MDGTRSDASHDEHPAGNARKLLSIPRRRFLQATAAAGALGTLPSLGSAASLSAPWSNQDVGNPDAAGSASESGGTFTIEGSGDDIWGSSDEFHYAHQSLSGDGEMVAEITNFDGSQEWSKAGVMIREDLDAGSKHASMVMTGSNGTEFLSRDTTGGTTDGYTSDSVTEPYYLKIERSGDTFTGYKSTDGVSWTQVDSVTVDMASDATAGLAVTSHDDGTVATATFEHVSVLPSPWQSDDVGSVSAPGTASESGGTFTIEGSGDDIWDSSDEFHYVHQTLSGDGAAVAKVTDVEHTADSAKAGVMVREDLTPDAKHAYMEITPDPGYGTAFVWRDSTGGSSDAVISEQDHAAPYYVKIEREGDSLTGYIQSPNGADWITVGSVDVSMSNEVRIGMAVTSKSDGTLCTGTFDDVSINRSLWDNQDIGDVDASGSLSASNGTYTVTGAGEDIWNQADEFHYAHQSLSGDGEMVAEVTSVEHTHDSAKAGVMIREDLTPDAKHAYMEITPDPGYGTAFVWRDSTGGDSSATVPYDSIDAPYYVKVERDGNTLLGYKSPDGSSWNEVDRVTFDMSSDAYVGLAVTSHNAGTLCTATFENVSTNGRGLSLAGGSGYHRVYRGDPDHTVSSNDWTTFKNTVESASSGETVFVASDIDVPNDVGSPAVTLPSEVTLASDRGQNGSDGAQINYSEQQDSIIFMEAKGDNRITGLRFEGPTRTDPGDWNGYASHGTLTAGANIEVDNCEYAGWNGYAVMAGSDVYVHHCSIHHNKADGYGYGVGALNGAHPHVKYCWLNDNRHTIAAESYKGEAISEWTVEDSVIGPDGAGHIIDHHGPADSANLTVRDTTIMANGSTGIKLRDEDSSDGTPNRLDVENVWFYHDTKNDPCGQSGDPLYTYHDTCPSSWSDLNVYLTNNVFDPNNEPSSDVGGPR